MPTNFLKVFQTSFSATYSYVTFIIYMKLVLENRYPKSIHFFDFTLVNLLTSSFLTPTLVIFFSSHFIYPPRPSKLLRSISNSIYPSRLLLSSLPFLFFAMQYNLPWKHIWYMTSSTTCLQQQPPPPSSNRIKISKIVQKHSLMRRLEIEKVCTKNKDLHYIALQPTLLLFVVES